ncbi:MAG: DUF5695 domain-containing protein, partial [Fimbriimonadaceae bacterium]|nr:DUF5695 domain-containing protein [Fimbriimonadaceae bacterium]
MDPFEDDLPELTGTLLTLEFGTGGRIVHLWAGDPNLAEEGEEFQFVLPPIQFGEEAADDYLPGTILIGARTDPKEPWMLGRNVRARHIQDEEWPGAPGQVKFEYFFSQLEGLIEGFGTFKEVNEGLPHIVWDLELHNPGRRTVEIGELAFPMAFNNFYDGFGWNDVQLQKLWNSRVYIHKFIGGGASWLFAQRMTADPPGLLVFPGVGTSWEFYSHVSSSLNTPYQWEGIPIVYAASK